MAKNPLIRPRIRNRVTTKIHKSSGILDDYAVRKDIATSQGTITKTPTADIDIANKKYVDDEQGNHDIADHNDTTATGAELNTLTDNSIANTLHRHSELVASDGAPDPAVTIAANGYMGVGIAAPLRVIHTQNGSNAFRMDRTDLTYGPWVLMIRNPGLVVASSWVFGPSNIGGSTGDAFSIVDFGTAVAGVGGTARLTVTKTTGNVGLSVNDPHSRLEVNGAISSETSTFSTVGPTDNVDVAGVNTLFIDCSSNAVTIGGFSGGVAGQYLHVVRKCSTANNVTLENNEGGGSQDIFLHAGADETLNGEYGGWILVCDGSDWFDCSHSRHV